MEDYMKERNKLIELVTAHCKGKIIEYYDEIEDCWNKITTPYFDNKNLDYYRVRPVIQPYSGINAFAEAIGCHGPYIVMTDGDNEVCCIPDLFDNDSCRIMDSFTRYTELTDSNKYHWIDGTPCGIEQ